MTARPPRYGAHKPVPAGLVRPVRWNAIAAGHILLGMAELAVTFRPTGEATERLAGLHLPRAMREHLIPRLHALAQHHLSASAMAIFLAALIRAHVPGPRITAGQLEVLVPQIVDALVAPEDAPKVSGLYALTVAGGPLPCVRPLDDGWPADAHRFVREHR